jgi:hypothetical protein
MYMDFVRRTNSRGGSRLVQTFTNTVQVAYITFQTVTEPRSGLPDTHTHTHTHTPRVRDDIHIPPKRVHYAIRLMDFKCMGNCHGVLPHLSLQNSYVTLICSQYAVLTWKMSAIFACPWYFFSSFFRKRTVTSWLKPRNSEHLLCVPTGCTRQRSPSWGGVTHPRTATYWATLGFRTPWNPSRNMSISRKAHHTPLSGMWQEHNCTLELNFMT